MGRPLRFNTGDASVDACLSWLAALADQRTRPVADGLSLEDWIDEVLRAMRTLPDEVRRSLKPEALYCWGTPRSWDRLRVVEWHSKAAAGLLSRLTRLSKTRKAPAAEPAAALSSSMGVTHSYRRYLEEGLTAMYADEMAAVPLSLVEQIARLAVTEAVRLSAPVSAVGPETSSSSDAPSRG